jgi:hypothetical protein
VGVSNCSTLVQRCHLIMEEEEEEEEGIFKHFHFLRDISGKR